MKEKDYEVEVTLRFTQITPAISEEEALQKTRETFIEEYNIEPEDDEMKIIS